MASPLCSPDRKKTGSNSQKSNDRILPVYLIVLTRQENYGLQTKSDSILELFCSLFVQSEFFFHLKNINIPEKYQIYHQQLFDLTIRMQSF